MGLRDELFISGSWVNSANRFSNTVGSLVNAVSVAERSGLMADVYTLVVSARSGDTGTITITTANTHNPWNGRVVTGVTVTTAASADKTTLPGLSLEYENASVNGDTTVITVGEQKGSFQSGGITGTPSTGVRHRVTNTEVTDLMGCKAKLITQAIYLPITGTGPFYLMKGFAADAIEKVDGTTGQLQPYALVISDVVGTGTAKLATLSVDGDVPGEGTIKDLTTEELVSGTSLKATNPTASQLYEIVSGSLTGLIFGLHEDTVDTDEANVVIVPSRHIQIAPDNAGVAGTYGTSDVDLTETGEDVGTITASGVAYFWTRIAVEAGESGKANPYLCNVALVANISAPEPGGWLD